MNRQERMNWCLGVRRTLPLLAALVALAVCSPPLVAQQPFDPLTQTEIEQAKSLLLGDARVSAKLGDSRYRILNVERKEHPKNVALTADRAANVTLYDYTRDEAIVATVRLGSNPGVDSIVTTRGPQPSLSPEELEEARQLAMAQPDVQSRLQSFGAPETLMVTHLFAKALDKDDACATHRCVILFFNTQDAVLDITPVVDLSAQKVHVK